MLSRYLPLSHSASVNTEFMPITASKLLPEKLSSSRLSASGSFIIQWVTSAPFSLNIPHINSKNTLDEP